MIVNSTLPYDTTAVIKKKKKIGSKLTLTWAGFTTGWCHHMKITNILKNLVYELLKLMLAVYGAALVDHGLCFLS